MTSLGANRCRGTRIEIPYRIWISEIMLQQTQVTAVIPFYEAFMARFPDVASLATATTDEVMAHWSGLGYYARARNLHKAAQQIMDCHGGVFPREIEEVVALPGIGRSTAGAILAFCFNQRHPILDGNVKRVLARYFAIAGYPGTSAVSKQLWSLADELTPANRVADYTQAIMDLGATLCTRSKPGCAACPQSTECLALDQGTPTAYPTPKPKKIRPERSTTMGLFVDAGGQVLLEKRPPTGIWGGLWSLPEAPDAAGLTELARGLGLVAQSRSTELQRLQHGFTHFILHIDPVVIQVSDPQPAVSESDTLIWIDPSAHEDLGLPKPVTTLLTQLSQLRDPTNVIT